MPFSPASDRGTKIIEADGGTSKTVWGVGILGPKSEVGSFWGYMPTLRDGMGSKAGIRGPAWGVTHLGVGARGLARRQWRDAGKCSGAP